MKRKYRSRGGPSPVTSRLPGHQVRDREPDKGKHRPETTEILHIPTLVWIMREIDSLQDKLIADSRAASREDAAVTLDWNRQKVIGLLQREWDRQRQKLSRLNRKTAEKILHLERTVARRKAGKLLRDLRQLAKLEQTVGRLAEQALRGRAARHWMFVETASEAPEGGGLVELPEELIQQREAEEAAEAAEAEAEADETSFERPELVWTKELVEQVMSEFNPAALLAEGLDAAFLGPLQRCGQPTLAAYSYSKAVAVLQKQGMSLDEAAEWMDFNVVGAWCGEHTPAWLLDVTNGAEDEDEDGDDG